jgi:anti-sigma-K factor RskA
MNYERPGLVEKLADHYVLGTMSGRARARFARVLATSVAAQQAVAAVNAQLAPLYQAIAPVTPPAHVWRSIASRTGRRAPSPIERWRGGLSAWLDGWCWGRLTASFCVGAAIGVVLVSHQPHTFGMHHVSASLPASYVGVLVDADGAAVLTAGAHRHGATLTVKLIRPLDVPPGMVARLWALPRLGAPQAIADVPASGKAVIALGGPAEEVFADVPQLALSYESDPAASAPTAPFVLTGLCVKMW